MGVSLVGGLLIGILAAPAPASAVREPDYLTASSWTYTDSRSPEKSFGDLSDDVPLGARADKHGVVHRHRLYATFDLSRFERPLVREAELIVFERSATDCATAQPVELWRTDPVTRQTSWDSPPRRHELLGTIQAGGAEKTCPGRLAWDLMATFPDLLDDDVETLTVEFAVPSDDEGDVTRGRVLQPPPDIRYVANHSPVLERVGLWYPDWSCGTRSEPTPVPAPRPFASDNSTEFVVEATDADPRDVLNAEFAAWPVDREEERTTRRVVTYFVGDRLATKWDMTQYEHGTVVAWTARVSDEEAASEWSQPCFVTIDTEVPVPPGVISTDFPSDGQPHGGQGIPGVLTFSANGSDDVVGYNWGPGDGSPLRYVEAPSPGGDATVSFTPDSTAWSETISVRSVDRAGNLSEFTTYEILVAQSAPRFEVEVGGVGVPSQLHLSSRIQGVTGYGYRIGDAAEVRIPARADRTADASVVFTSAGSVMFTVSSYIEDRMVGTHSESVYVSDAPIVE